MAIRVWLFNMVAEGDKRTLQDVENFYNTFFEEILVSVADFI